MHILFTLDTWGLIGGTERYAAVVVPALLERGHRVTVLCREDLREGMADVPVIEVSELGAEGLSKEASRELARRVREAAPDVVYVSTLRNMAANALLVDLAPLVRFVHDHTLFCPGLNKYREDGETCRDPMGLVCLQRYWLGSGCVCFKPAGHKERFLTPLKELYRKHREIALVQRSSLCLTNSEYMRGELLKVGFSPDRTSVLYLFTRSNTPHQPAGTLAADVEGFLAETQGPLLFTPARLTLPDKGVDFLLTALARVRSPFRAIVSGSGPAETWLREKAIEEGLAERVFFTGWIDSAGIEALYARADIVICPSVWDEPFGLVGLEAMAHAKPVVAFDVGGIPEWLTHGETGLLVPRKDVDAMAQAVDRLLDEPGLASAYGQAGRRALFERFAPEQHVEQLESLLSQASS